MSVTVDQEPLAAGALGLSTLGQVLAHVQKSDRLVVRVVLDGREPDADELPAIRQQPLEGHELFIETADPRHLAAQALDEVGAELAEADRLKGEAADLLQQNQLGKAMEKLSGCLSTWNNAQESTAKTAQLLRIDLETIRVDDIPLGAMLEQFSQHLRSIKSSLEQRDFVSLSDTLLYEMTETTRQWQAALAAMRNAVG